MSASRNIKKPLASKNLKNRSDHTSSISRESSKRVESLGVPPLGYRHAKPMNSSGYTGATPTAHIIDGHCNVIGDEEFTVLLKNYIQDPGFHSTHPSNNISFDSDSHPWSSTPSARFASAQNDDELTQDKSIEVRNQGQTHAPSSAESYTSGVVYAKEHDRPNQKLHRDIPDQRYNGSYGASPECHETAQRVSSARPMSFQSGDMSSQRHNRSRGTSPQYQWIAPREGLVPQGGLVHQILLGTQKELPPIPPDLSSRNAPSSRQQTQGERRVYKESSQDLGVHGSKPAVHGSQSEDTTSRRLESKHDWDNKVTSQVQGYQKNVINQYQASSDENFVQLNPQDLPLPSVKVPISEDDYEDGKLNLPPTKGGAASKRKTEIVRGKTRGIRDNLEYKQDGKWVLAFRLANIRAFIKAQEKLRGTYKYQWARGIDENDITSYHPFYETYGWERDQRPDILFQLERKGDRTPPYNPRIWMCQGRVVLDSDDNPIKLWRKVPLLCSSQMSGAELEAISRTNPEMPLSAIRARMPAIFTGEEWCPPTLNTLRMRMSRFRAKAGLITWNKREGSRQIQQEIFKILGPQCIHENSTRSFRRDLTEEEIAKVKGVNEGTAPQRSRRKKRSAEWEEGPVAPKPKRQKKMPIPFSQEESYGQAGSSVRTSSEGQESAPKLGDSPKPDPQAQKRAHKQPNQDKSEDSCDSLLAQRLYAGHKNHIGDPQVQRGHGCSEHPLGGRPSDVLPSLPSLDTQGHMRKRERHWAEEYSDEGSDGEDLAPPMKRLHSSSIPQSSNKAVDSPAAVVRYASGIRYLASAPTHGKTNDNNLFNSSQLRRQFAKHKTVIPSSQPPIHTPSIGTPGKEERVYKTASSRPFQSSASHQGESVLPTPCSRTVKIVPRETSGNHTRSKVQQTDSYVSHKASGDINQPFKSQMPINELGPQTLSTDELASSPGFSDSTKLLRAFSAPNAKPIGTPQTGTALFNEIFGADIVIAAARQLANNPQMRSHAENVWLSSNSISSQQWTDSTNDWDLNSGVLLDAAESHGHAQCSAGSGVDFRYMNPRNTEEEAHIQKALSFTQDNFQELSGEKAPDTPRDQSYDFQHKLLQMDFADIWACEKPQPDLFYFHNPWRSFTDWEVSVI